MSTTRDPDAILAAWLDEGPTELPDMTRRAILGAIPTTQQARRSWFGLGHQSWISIDARLVAAALVVVVAAAALLTVGGRPDPGAGRPSPSPTIAPSPPLDPATWVPFTSNRLGIRLRFPPGWSVQPATAPWIWQLRDPGPVEAAGDRAFGPATEAFVVSSQHIPAGMDEATWWADYLSADTSGMPAGCFPPTLTGYERLVVAGVPGYVHGGLVGCNFTEAVVLTGGRAYQLTAYARYALPSGGVFDRRLFDAWLSTVTFDPSAADDRPVASPANPG
jgi:hypothetical protein